MKTDDFGGFPPSIRWNSDEETDQLNYVETNEVFEREVSPIALNTSASTFVMDVLRREQGRGRIATGTYKMLLAPVGQEVPPIPEDELPFVKDYKPAIGVTCGTPSTVWCASKALRLMSARRSRRFGANTPVSPKRPGGSYR